MRINIPESPMINLLVALPPQAFDVKLTVPWGFTAIKYFIVFLCLYEGYVSALAVKLLSTLSQVLVILEICFGSHSGDHRWVWTASFTNNVANYDIVCYKPCGCLVSYKPYF